jgi:hypothetical protein
LRCNAFAVRAAARLILITTPTKTSSIETFKWLLIRASVVKRIPPTLNAADGFPVNIHKLGETFLRHPRTKTGSRNIAANDSQDFGVLHALSWSV